MDYIKLTVRQLRDLVCLDNVTNPYDMKDILEAPAVSDILIEVTSPQWPNDVICTNRIRTDVDRDPDAWWNNELQVVTRDGCYKPFEGSMKERITDCCIHMTGLTVRHIAGERKIVWSQSARMTVLNGGMDIVYDFDPERPRRPSRFHLDYCQQVYHAWLELNWLILNQPQVVRAGRIAQDLIPSLKKTAEKPRKKKATKGRTKVYLRMLTVPPEKSPDWETLKAKTPEAVQERAIREITCPVWEVRGHMRHYKSGKTVYVAPYRKGKERDSASAVPGKEYVLTGGDHAGKN